MKNLFKNRLVLIGLLLLTAATVTASEPVIKPDTATKSTGARIVPVAGGLWNYTDPQLFAAAHAAVPTVVFTKVIFETPAAGVYWLTFQGTVTATGAPHTIYFPLIKNGSWYEIDPSAVPPGWTGGGAGPASCTGDCEILLIDAAGSETWVPTGDVCMNVSKTWMVSCSCAGCGCSSSTDCEFRQGGYPISVTETLYNALKQIHD